MDKGPPMLFRSTNESLGDAPDIFSGGGAPAMAAAIKRFATRASRLITKRIGNVSQHLVVTPSRSATVARLRKR
jgi:hypothetical protein